MIIRKAALGALLLVLGCQAATVPVQQADIATTTPDAAALSELEQALKADVYWLADEQREGRGIGTDGIEQAAQYAARRFAQLGLEPAGEVGYFDTFTINAGRNLLRELTTLEFADAQLTLEEDFVPYGWSKPDTFSGELVFGGYSITSDARGYDDFANIDVKGKVVLALRYEPHDDQGGSQFLTEHEQKQLNRSFSREAEFFRKARAAEAAGAAALLIVNPPTHHDDLAPIERFSSFDGRQRVGIPVMQVSPETADLLLAGAKLPTLATLQENIDSTGKPHSQAGDPLTVSGTWASEDSTIVEKNVVAMFRGSGALADEFVVVGGHYDHVGNGEYGSRSGVDAVHYGADDNASGTASVMALAQMVAEANAGEGRSVLFVLFSAEEIGLIGSREFVADLPVEKEQVVAMLNYDMLGRPADRLLQVGGIHSAKVFPSMLDSAIGASGLEWADSGPGLDGRSDHASFDRVGIPALFFFGSIHADYHTERDTPDKIDYDFLARATWAGFDILQALRTMDAPVYRSPDQRRAALDAPTRPTEVN